jgi:hypothetical protein
MLKTPTDDEAGRQQRDAQHDVTAGGNLFCSQDALLLVFCALPWAARPYTRRGRDGGWSNT